jgi:lipid A 3-O-deacylase
VRVRSGFVGMAVARVSGRSSLIRNAVAALALLGSTVAGAHAEDADRITVLEENDSLYFNSDKHYTQGLRVSNLGPAVTSDSGWNGPFDFLGSIFPIFAREAPHETSRRYALFVGQSIFTPKNLRLKPPDPTDRPYAGWFYTGASLLQETDHFALENLEIDLGVVGPGAFGKQVQNNFHQLIGVGQARGWSNQIQNEPGAMLSYERLWRFSPIGDGNDGIDVVPQIGATVGNVLTYAGVGGLLRIGKNLHGDYGPARIRPALSGTDYFDGSQFDGAWGFYFYAGAHGRAVGHNIFLDGNTFRRSPSVPRKTLVADFQGGFAVFNASGFRLDVSAVRRTREFVGQRANDVIGTAAVSFSW